MEMAMPLTSLVPVLVLALPAGRGFLQSPDRLLAGVPESRSGRLEISDCVRISARPDERTHPVRKLARIRGIFSEALAARHDPFPEDFRAFSEQVLAANAALLGLPAGSGRLVFDRVRFTDTLTIADYHQEAEVAGGSRVSVDGSTLKLFYDKKGSLTQIANLIYLGVDGLQTARLDVDGAKKALDTGTPIYVERPKEDGESESLAWSPNQVEQSQLVLLPGVAGHRLAWRLLANGRLSRGTEQRRVWVDAQDGRVLKNESCASLAEPSLQRQATPEAQVTRSTGGSLVWPRMAGHWPLDGSGEDVQGDEDLVWTPAPSNAYVPGVTGLALPANYTWLGKVRVPQSFSCPIDYSYSMMIWVFPQQVIDDSVIMKRGSPAPHTYLALFGGKVSCYQEGSFIGDPADLPLNTWSHVAVTYSYDQASGTGVLKLFTNGALVSQVPGTPPYPYADNPAYQTDGIDVHLDSSTSAFLIDDLGLMNWALSDAEIATIHADGLQGFDLSHFLPSPAVPPIPRYRERGRALVCDPYPNDYDWRSATNWSEVILNGMDATRNTIAGKHANVRGYHDDAWNNAGWNGVGIYQCTRDYRDLPSAPYPIREQATDPVIYYGISRFRSLLTQVGFGGLGASSITVFAHTPFNPPNLTDFYYTLEPKYISLRTNYLVDLDILLHEYGHLLQDASDGDPEQTWGCPAGNSSTESASMSEAEADFLSSSFLNDARVSEYSAHISGLAFLRTLDNDLVRQNVAGALCHAQSRAWSAAWWNLREHLGSGIVTPLSLQWMFYMLPTDDFDSALETCVLQADEDLYSGIHEDVIRRVFSIRQIYGSAGSYPWSSSFPMSQRPYADNVDETQSYTIPGATALRVTFDAYTKARWYETQSNNPDFIHVMDRAGSPIAGSPFIARALQNATVTVPGNTVRIRMQSVPNDTYVAAGYRVINVAAVNPANQPPVAVFEASSAEGMAPLVIDFDVSGSFDPDGDVIAYTLDPGDGSPVIRLDPQIQLVSHIYHRNGAGPIVQPTDFQAILTVTDSNGQTNVTGVPIHINPYSEGPSEVKWIGRMR